jgi:hypothetical protein
VTSSPAPDYESRTAQFEAVVTMPQWAMLAALLTLIGALLFWSVAGTLIISQSGQGIMNEEGLVVVRLDDNGVDVPQSGMRAHLSPTNTHQTIDGVVESVASEIGSTGDVHYVLRIRPQMRIPPGSIVDATIIFDKIRPITRLLSRE